MRIRSLSVAVAGVAVVIAMVSAPLTTSIAHPALQATAAATQAPYTGPKCADTKLIADLQLDATTLVGQLGKMTAKSTGEDIYAFITSVSDARIKYEDMENPADEGCSYLVYEALVWFADLGDLGTVLYGTTLKVDQTALATRTTAVLARLKDQTKNVTDLIAQ